MSKAFTDEEAADLPALVPARAPLPDGVPNYVTRRGLELLREELAALATERARADAIASDKERGRALGALTQRRVELERRIATAVVPPPAESLGAVRFGSLVTVTGESGERRYQIVGVDEADPALGKIAFTSPLARALIGKSEGDTVEVVAPGGVREYDVLVVRYI